MKTILFISLFILFNNKFTFSQEVVFVQKDKKLASFGYSSVTTNISGINTSLSYRNYVDKKGEIIGERTNGFSNYYEIKLENGETVFSTYSSDKYDIREGKYHSMDDFYFVEDYEKAKKWLNKYVYVVNKYKWNIELLNYDDNDNFIGKITIENYEKVKVLNVLAKVFGKGSGISSFYILVEKENGEKGYIQYEMLSSDNIITKYDINIQKLIQERKIIIGMTQEQVLLSWGKPDDINRNVGSWGNHEQWIYGNSYIYFKNGKLTSWQD